MGEDLDTLTLRELQNLEHQLDTALKHVRTKKVRKWSEFEPYFPNAFLFVNFIGDGN